MATLREKHRQLSPWWTVLAGVLGAGMGAGPFLVIPFGLFIGPIGSEFHWSRAAVQSSLTAFLIATGFGAVTLGQIIRLWGARRSAILFTAVFATAVMAAGALPPSPLLVYADFAIIGFFGAAASGLPYSVMISGWFDADRGRALGIASCGGGLGGLLAPQFAHFFIANLGWRQAFFATGAAIAVVSIFGLVVLSRDPPEDRRREAVAAGGSDLTAYLSKRAFWLILTVILALSAATFGVLTMIVPILTDRGISVASAANLLSLMGVLGCAAQLAVGSLLDRAFAPFVAAAVLLLTAVGLALIGGELPITAAYVGAGLIGLSLGSEAGLLTYLVSRYFDRDAYSRVVGAMWVVWSWSGGIGTFIASKTFDIYRSYAPAFWILGLLLAAGAGAALWLGPYVYPPPRRRAGELQSAHPV